MNSGQDHVPSADTPEFIGVQGSSAGNPAGPEPNESEVGDEVQASRARLGPQQPTEQDRADHEASGHVAYRSWCRHCVSARGVGQQHRTRGPDGDTAVSLVVADYAYMADEGSSDTLPILVLRDRITKSYGATAVQRTGTDSYALQFL